MKHFVKFRTLISGAALSVVLLASSTSGAFAQPATDAGKKPSTPPTTSFSSGPQAKAPIEPGSKDAKATEKLGSTEQVKTNAQGAPETSVTPLAGSVANVDFQSPLNYCWKNLVYTPIKNTTAATKYVRVLLYNQGSYRDLYTTVNANSTAYPAFYGVDGAYTAYLYVWNGSSYQYDEYLSNTNTCQVSVTRTYNTGGWVQLKIQNTGTAYATQVSTELAPYPASGTYTGTQYDYPVAGGAAIYRWFYVGTQPYGIVSSTYGSFNSPYLFSGDL